ncbi:hypothetical protein [Acetoanaerobium noterae]|uniref:hypothetical protein n=1 Tax=Acetoanaerobium noterae TaxID=745369 RepID=UPI003331E54F
MKKIVYIEGIKGLAAITVVTKPRCQTLSYEALSYLVGQVIKDLAKKFVRFLHY